MEEDKLKYKEILCKTMKSFINICKEHNLQYYACAGTCLGAIRHKGMIPWDDDIDVLMPRSDYDKFLALKQNRYLTGSFASLPNSTGVASVATPIALSSAPASGLACGSATCCARTK